jgi:glycerol-3-phosphate dehydrogenase
VTTNLGWSRADHVGRLRDEGPFDVLVIGGGITGCGAALDLAARGAHVALVEQADFAAGTSSRSTKLLHGGVRYLPQLHLRLVAEGLREQKVLARNADHLFRPLEFVVPLYEQHGFASAPRWLSTGRRAAGSLRLALTAYDLLGGRDRPGQRHRGLDADAVQALFPKLRPEGLHGGCAYSDAQTQDARLVISVAKTAVRCGAVAVNRVRVDALDATGDRWRARVTDTATGAVDSVTARAVLAATGAFAVPSGGRRDLPLVLSKGTHVLVPRDAVGLGEHALVLPETEDRRVMYLVPWLGHALIGTTDVPYGDEPGRPRASDEEVDYLLRHVAAYLDVEPIEPLSTFAGVRALASDARHGTGRASREHVVRELAPGYVAVAGGKLTTYRRIAAEAADRVADHVGLRRASTSADVPLAGAWDGTRPDIALAALTGAGLDADAAATVVGRYGADALAIAEVCRAEPCWATPLGSGVLAEAVFAVRDEAAVEVADVTLRRTVLALSTRDHARAHAAAVADAMGAELDWTRPQRAAAIARHEAALVAEGL